MIAFQYPRGTKKLLKDSLKREDAIVGMATRAMEDTMEGAIEYILEHWTKTQRYVPPSLAGLDQITESFYRNVLHSAAVVSTQHSKLGRMTEKRLSGKLPSGMPRSMRDLNRVFRDKRYWPKIMKRSKILTERIRKSYLKKLEKKFKTIIPDILDNKITIEEAKEQLRGAWKASKARVETTFRTEATTYFAKSTTAFFNGDKSIIGFLFDSIADRSRSEWCRTRHGIVYRPGTVELTKNTPACHWNCRSHLIALADTPDNRKLLKDPRRDPANRKVKPLPPGWQK